MGESYLRRKWDIFHSAFCRVKGSWKPNPSRAGYNLLKIMAALTECNLAMFQKKLFLRAYLQQYRVSKQTEEE